MIATEVFLAFPGSSHLIGILQIYYLSVYSCMDAYIHQVLVRMVPLSIMVSVVQVLVRMEMVLILF